MADRSPHMLCLDDDTLVLSASDLTSHLACAHLTEQQIAIARRERPKPRPLDDPHAALIRARGDAYEQEKLEQMVQEVDDWLDLSVESPAFSRDALNLGAARTEQAMRAGVSLIYQALLFDQRWQGRFDFLRRVDRPSGLGDWSYVVLDTKLARKVKPEYVNQVSLYSRLVGQVQGRQPEIAYVILGDGSITTIQLERYAALHRHTIDRLEQIVTDPGVDTYPEPVAHCGICLLSGECDARRRFDDHLSLVAGARRSQRDALVAAGFSTMRSLAAAAEDIDPPPLRRERFLTLHRQAELQLESQDTQAPTHRHLAPTRAAGYAALPDPDPGDVFFDLEGDPYIGDSGIEYLWGWCDSRGRYEWLWAHNADEEKRRFEAFIDAVMDLRIRHPDMHVFHYAPHERAKLRSLSIQYASREPEVDELLRGEALVDLFAVVRQAMQVGEESYSLKRLERHYGFRRLEKRVREGGGSIVAYENWLQSGDGDLLEAIRAYNEEDCRSTLALRDWLLTDMLPQAEAQFSVDFNDLRHPEPVDLPQPPNWLGEVQQKVDALMEGLAALGDADTTDEAERRLLAQLLLYHHRESKPGWWRYFDLRGKPIDDLIDDRDAIAGLVRDESAPPIADKRSLLYRFGFDPQEHRLAIGDAQDPGTGETFNIVELGDDQLMIRRGNTQPPPGPTALVASGPINVKVLREALVELADTVLAGGTPRSASRRLLRREPPWLASGRLGETTKELIEATLGLQMSVLPVQGPPGTGKTFNGARMIVEALAAGKRVGLTAFSHAAIHNLMRALEDDANEKGVTFHGVYKRGTPYDSRYGLIDQTDVNDGVTDDHQLVAGTAWLFARPEHREGFDLIFVDEAGQFSLANAAAVGLAGGSLILLGDPQQLPQVTQAPHPAGAGASVLEHVLAGADTIPPHLGVLLTESWRMHPEVCAFVSERSYDSKLRSRAECERRRVDAPSSAIAGAGLRSLRVPHSGCSQQSPEEARAIAAICRDLLAGSTITDDDNRQSPLTPRDILVVAPYNMAVRCIAGEVPDGVRVGTVDRFQGQEAAVVFYAMTCSSGDDAPRGLGFLFDKNRLNVAISRAQCLAVLVHSPRLLDSHCPDLPAMELIDGICRFVELATPVRA